MQSMMGLTVMGDKSASRIKPTSSVLSIDEKGMTPYQRMRQLRKTSQTNNNTVYVNYVTSKRNQRDRGSELSIGQLLSSKAMVLEIRPHDQFLKKRNQSQYSSAYRVDTEENMGRTNGFLASGSGLFNPLATSIGSNPTNSHYYSKNKKSLMGTSQYYSCQTTGV
mmetsp:Transcript_42131/g.40375  ORF Transcript_42131/g.40375 Transcript_42131/m.40375 type:complete len:165 (-) Transcript_42131:256-750(-)